MGPAAAIIAGSHSGMSSNSSREAERVPDEGIEPSNARSKRAVMPLNEPAQWRTLRELNSPLLREKQMSLPIDEGCKYGAGCRNRTDFAWLEAK
jgi:hypothetical protein